MREQFALDALNDALNRETLSPELMIHTDRGAQFMSARYESLVKRKGAFISIRKGYTPLDNAVMESLHKSLKTELVDKKHPFESRSSQET